jgi:hypothetical protein
VIEIAPGLRRWTAYHDHWEEQVGSLALETDDGLVLIDPIDPPRGLRRPDHVLLTVFWHGRSTAELKAKRVWAHTRSAQPLRNRGVEVTDAFKPGDELPGGLEAFATARVNEVVFWLPAQAPSRAQRATRCGSARSGGSGKGRMPTCARRCNRCSRSRCNGCSSPTESRCFAQARPRSHASSTSYAATESSGSSPGGSHCTSSRSMREPSMSSTRNARPSCRTSSPSSGARPSSPKTKPATVW